MWQRGGLTWQVAFMNPLWKIALVDTTRTFTIAAQALNHGLRQTCVLQIGNVGRLGRSGYFPILLRRTRCGTEGAWPYSILRQGMTVIRRFLSGMKPFGSSCDFAG